MKDTLLQDISLPPVVTVPTSYGVDFIHQLSAAVSAVEIQPGHRGVKLPYLLKAMRICGFSRTMQFLVEDGISVYFTALNGVRMKRSLATWCKEQGISLPSKDFITWGDDTIWLQSPLEKLFVEDQEDFFEFLFERYHVDRVPNLPVPTCWEITEEFDLNKGNFAFGL